MIATSNETMRKKKRGKNGLGIKDLVFNVYGPGFRKQERKNEFWF